MNTSTNHPDVLLVGAGIMSATLAVILKELDPQSGNRDLRTSGQPGARKLQCLEQRRHRPCSTV